MQMYGVRDPNGQLLAVGYEPVGGVLRVRWKKGEGENRGVPENVFVSIRKVPFAYAYYQKVVKGKYPYTKIDDPPAEPPKQAAQKASNSMEVFFPQDGMEFHEADANGNPAHYYTLKGERVPFSLTQVLQLAGLAREPQSAKEAEAWAAKAVLGTKVHEYTLWLDQDEIALNDLKAYPSYFNRVLGWKQFCDDFKFMPDLTMCEVPIGVRVNGMLYATKVDAYGVIGDESNLAMAVVEKKCSVNIEPHYALQTAGEALAFKQHTEVLQMPLKRFLVQLLETPNGSGKCYKCVEHTDRNDEKVFVGAALMNCYMRLGYGTLKGN